MKRSQDADVHTIKIGKERLAQAAQLPCTALFVVRIKTIIFDTETTGLNPREDEIIQISIIDGLGNVLINELVHPYWKKSWSEAARVNGITPDRVANAPYPHELIPKVKGIFAAADLLVAYNNQFDLNFLEQWGIQTTGKKQYDVMMAFAVNMESGMIFSAITMAETWGQLRHIMGIIFGRMIVWKMSGQLYIFLSRCQHSNKRELFEDYFWEDSEDEFDEEEEW